VYLSKAAEEGPGKCSVSTPLNTTGRARTNEGDEELREICQGQLQAVSFPSNLVVVLYK
jgi:hypothetical protein